jgi:hypothetical protein
MRNPAVAAVLTLSLASGAVASAEPAAGAERVRLALKTPSGKRLSGRIVGDLVASGPETLTVRAGGREVVVKRAEISRMERSLGRHSRAVGGLRGAAIGAGIGAVLGAGIGLLSGDDPEPVRDCPPYDGFGFIVPPCGPLFTFSAQDKAAIDGTVLGVLGAVAGGIGGAVAPGERWQRQRADGPALALRPQRRGLGAELALRF